MAVQSARTRLPEARLARAYGSQRAGVRTALAARIATFALPVLALLVCVAGTRTDVLVPVSIRPVPTAMAGPLYWIGFQLSELEVILALAAMLAAYGLVVWRAESVPARTMIGAVIAFNAIVLIGPPLFSTDVFSYQAYGKMFAYYHLNPYRYGPSVIGINQLYYYIGKNWINTPSVYGPLFTFFSGIFAWSSIAFSEFAFKLIAAVSSGGALWLIWRSCKLRGVSPVRGIALFGLSPLVTLSGVGGGHNDLPVALLSTGGVYALLNRRERGGGILMTAAAAVKLTGGVLLPFALLAPREQDSGRRRRAFAFGVAAVAVVMAAASFAVWGTGILHLPGTLQTAQAAGTWQGTPSVVTQILGISAAGTVRAGMDVVLAAWLLWLLWRVWHGRLDWIEGAAWGTFAVLVTAWSMMPWYITWLLPLVALTSRRRLWVWTLLLTLGAGVVLIAGCVPAGTI